VKSHPDVVAKLEALYRERYAHFLRVAFLITGDEERAHDAEQDGLAGAIHSRHSFRGEGPLEAWVWRAVVNAAKRQGHTASVPFGREPISQNGDASDERLIRTWVAALPERQRLAVYMRYYADLDYRQIATALDIAVGTVSATLSAAHQTLRKSMQEVPK
jgi:RNA polymerase sigma-70 factor (ECF subfamily)